VAVLSINEVEAVGTRALVELTGEIDLDTVGQLKDALQGLLDRGITQLVIDMKETSYVNSSALAVLVKFRETYHSQGGGIALVAVTPRVRMPFDMLGLTIFFKFYDTVDEAKNAFPAQTT